MKRITSPVKPVILIFIAFILSYYILMTKQTIFLSQAIASVQFWFMLFLGAAFFYGYFRYSEYLNQRVIYKDQGSIFIFLIVRLLLGVWLPGILILFFLKQLFNLWGLNFSDSGYLATEYFMLMVILYSTTIGFVAFYFYNKYQQVQRCVDTVSSISQREFPVILADTNEILNTNKDVDSDKQLILKRTLIDMLLHVVILRKRSNNILLFRDNGTCELFVSDPKIIECFIQEETVLQINRGMWVNTFYIKEVKRENNEDLIGIDQELEFKYCACRSFYETSSQNQADDKSNLFIGKAYKSKVKLWLKNNRGNIDA